MSPMTTTVQVENGTSLIIYAGRAVYAIGQDVVSDLAASHNI